MNSNALVTLERKPVADLQNPRWLSEIAGNRQLVVDGAQPIADQYA